MRSNWLGLLGPTLSFPASRDWISRRQVLFVAFGFAFCLSRAALADVISVTTAVGDGQVGAYFGPYLPSDDAPPGYPPILPPDNDPTFQNYFLGRSTILGMTTSERRAFFFFDMAGIAASVPAGEVITDVSIALELLPGGTSALANFATEDKEIVDFTATTFTPDVILDPEATGTPFEDVWDTFGTGTPYGGFEIFGPDAASPTVPDTYEITLPGSIPDLTDAIAAGDIFVVTARLATFDPGPIGTGSTPIDPFEYVFGLTDVVSSTGPTTAAPTLTFTTSAVPEPATPCVLTSFAAVLCLRRRRR